ncbi:MAG: hypothetical protein GX256_01990 [Fretibacterium sp.]|nr:hypothetical protein [Fretibacterium sp.]
MKDIKKVPITVPEFLMPKKDLENPCPCQDRPVEMTFKTGIVFWLKALDDAVAEGETVCEAEVEKMTVELPSPASGVLCDILVAEGDEFDASSVLGHIAVGA